MSKGLNSCKFIGNLGQDPKQTTTQGGMTVVKFSLAVNYSVKVGDRYEDKVEWIPCTVFGRQADACAQYLSKGSQVFVSGRMSTQAWTDKEQVKRWSTSIIAREVIFLGGQGQTRQPEPPAPAEQQEAAGGHRSRQNEQSTFPENDQVPF